MASCEPKYTTLLDLARQSKIISGNTACLDGKIQAGLPFSGYPTGVDLTTIGSLGTVGGTERAVISGNSATTVFDVANPISPSYNPTFDPYSAWTWTNPLFQLNVSGLTLPITPISALTQTVGPIWTLTQTGMTGDHIIGTEYTGYSITYSPDSVTGTYSGGTPPYTYISVSGYTSAFQENFSAGTLDYKGPVDYLRSREDGTIDNRLTTKKLRVTGGASASTIGYVLTQVDEIGSAEWVFNSASASTNTFVVSGLLNGSDQLELTYNTGGSVPPIDLSALSGESWDLQNVLDEGTTPTVAPFSSTDSVGILPVSESIVLGTGDPLGGPPTTASTLVWLDGGDATINIAAYNLSNNNDEGATKISGQNNFGESNIDVSGGEIDINTTGSTIVLEADGNILIDGLGELTSPTIGDVLAAKDISGRLKWITPDSFTGGTGSCITNLYVTNIHGCSPITIYDPTQHIGSLATGINSIAWGTGTTASGDFSHAEGQNTLASGIMSHAEGLSTSATTDYAHAEGSGTLASGRYSHASGRDSIATGRTSYAEGSATKSLGESSHAEGIGSMASGDVSHAQGKDSIASGSYSHAEGDTTIASGESSHAEGGSTSAIGIRSHAEGKSTIAEGNESHAEGFSTQALGSTSHAGGSQSIASGHTSFVHSTNSLVIGDRSVILGGIDHNIGTGSENSVIIGGETGSIGTGSTSSGIFGGVNNIIEIDIINSAIIGGGENTIEIVTSGACGCPCDYVYDEVSELCVTYSATSATTGVAISKGPVEISYGARGARFCIPNSYPGTAITCIDSTAVESSVHYRVIGNDFWGTGTTSNGRLNVIGVNNPTMIANTNKWYGFSRCIDAPSDGQYLFGMGGDDYIQATLNGEVIVSLDWSASIAAELGAAGMDIQDIFKQWWVWPVDLLAGKNTLLIEGADGAGVQASFGCEIVGPFLPNTFTGSSNFHIFSGQTGIDLWTGNTIFSSLSTVGGTFDSELYPCPEDYTYDSCSGECIKVNECSPIITSASIIGGCSNTITNSAQFASILGGSQNIIDGSIGTTILGGQNITGSSVNTAYVPNLNINYQPDNDDTLSQLLVRDTDGTVKYRDASSISGGGTFTGNTSGDCVNALWVSNISGCTGDLHIGAPTGDIIFDYTGDTSTPNLFIERDGLIGIGTNSPFSGTWNGTPAGIEIQMPSLNDNIALAFSETGSRRFYFVTDFATTFEPVHIYGGAGPSTTPLLTFFTNDSGGVGGGRIGMGTVQPEGSFHISLRGDVADQVKYPDETNIVINNTSTGWTGATSDTPNSSAFRFDHLSTEKPGALITSVRQQEWESGIYSTNLELWNASGGTLEKRIEIEASWNTNIFGDITVLGKNNDGSDSYGILYTDLSSAILPKLMLSGSSGTLAQIGITNPQSAGISIGYRGETEPTYDGYGKQGDGFIYSSAAENGLNIISQQGTNKDDYIRFYVGNSTGAAPANTPDIHIQGSGSTRGNVGINTKTPTEKLNVEEGNVLVNHNQNENTKLTISNLNNGNIARSALSLIVAGEGIESAGTIIQVGTGFTSSGTWTGPYLPNTLNITTAGGTTSNRAHINIGSRRDDGETRFFGGGDGFDSTTLLGTFYTSGLTITDMVNTDTLRVRNGATTGYVLTSDVDGNATWQASTGETGNLQSVLNEGSSPAVPPWTSTDSVGILSGDSIVIGTGDILGGPPIGPASLLWLNHTQGTVYLSSTYDISGDSDHGAIKMSATNAHGESNIRVSGGGVEVTTPSGGSQFNGLSWSSSTDHSLITQGITGQINLQADTTSSTGSTFTLEADGNILIDGPGELHNPSVGDVLSAKDSSGRLKWSTPLISPTGNTSGTCIDVLWVSTISGCSPVTIGSSIQSQGSTASGINSFAYGSGNVASSDWSFAIGQDTTANALWAHAEGNVTIASGEASHAEGSNTFATGETSHAEGEGTIAGGDYSHAEGRGTTASNETSHSEGDGSLASGVASHAEGDNTTASGEHSHAEGSETIAAGARSHAEGYNTEVFPNSLGQYSHAQGAHTIAGNFGAHAAGYGGGSGIDGIVATGVTSFAHFHIAEGTNLGNRGAQQDYSAILGGRDHDITNNGSDSVIIGGQWNKIDSPAGTNYNAIIGGLFNSISGDTTQVMNYCSIIGGQSNIIRGAAAFGVDHSGIFSSHSSLISSRGGKYNTIVGGVNHDIDTNGSGNSIMGGLNHSMGQSSNSSIIGGDNNDIAGFSRSVIIGGQNITATSADTVFMPNVDLCQFGGALHSNTIIPCSPLTISPGNEGNVHIGEQGGAPVITLDILTPDEPGILIGEDSFIRWKESEQKLIIGEEEVGGKVVIEVEGDEILDVEKEKTKLIEGDFETEDGDIIVKSGNSKTVIIEDLPDVSAADLGTDLDGKIIDEPSDSRVKENPKPLHSVVNVLEFIKNVKGYQFTWSEKSRIGDPNKLHYGFMVDHFRDDLIDPKGQNFSSDHDNCNQIAKSMVRPNRTKFKIGGNSQPQQVDSLSYTEMIPFIVEGLKEVDFKVENLTLGSLGADVFVDKGEYDDVNKTIVLTLNDAASTEIVIPVEDLVNTNNYVSDATLLSDVLTLEREGLSDLTVNLSSLKYTPEVRKYVETLVLQNNTPTTITHNLNDKDIIVQVINELGELIIPDKVYKYELDSIDIEVSVTGTYKIITMK